MGHWVRNKDVAEEFRAYWQLLSKDPGANRGDDRPAANRKNKELRTAVEKLHQTPASLAEVPPGVTTIFSPRSGRAVLNMYAKMVDDTERLCLHHAGVRHQRRL